jgi:ferredoxin like protein
MSDTPTPAGEAPIEGAEAAAPVDEAAAPGAPGAMKIDAKLGLDVFKLDKEPHIVIDHEICRTECKKKTCITVCPADLYQLNDEGDIVVNWEGCLECGTCLICCDDRALSWVYPRGEMGVQYRMS